ncbi:MAG: 8-oxo-dGTP diphosphatase MutT [Proteobacteria bacterium]|nr:8-oxo-dGTP diphosphatase MutT [Pseudomonadota bacterium]
MADPGEPPRKTGTDEKIALPVLHVVAVALVDAEGRVLLAQRPAGKAMAGLWEFPGGKLEDGETAGKALIRELGEELGIVIELADLSLSATAAHDYEDFRLHMPLYVCRRWQGTPHPREGQALAWVRPAAMDEYNMPPADRPLVERLKRQL